MSDGMNGLAAWLLTYALHSTLLLAVALLTMRKLRSAATRDLLCKVAAFAALLTATAQSLIPRQTELQPLAGRWELQAAPEPHQPVRDIDPQTADVARSRVPVFAEPTASHAPAQARERWQPRWASWPNVVLIVWLASALGGITLLATRYRRVRRRFLRRVRSSDAELCAQLDELRRAAGIERPIVLSLSTEASSPVALGRSEICLPSGLLSKLSRAQRGTMFAHELAHLERRDPHWLLGFGWLEAIFAFQPLNRIARREFQRAAEQLCDDFALSQTQQPIALAQCLAEVATWLRGEKDVFPYPAMAESASPLLKRVERVLNGVREPLTVSRRVRWSAAGVIAVFVCVAPAVTGAVRNPTSPLPMVQRQKTANNVRQENIAAAVRALESGVVRFTFPARAGICGTGEEKDGTRMFALLPTREWLPARTPDMLALYVWDDGVLMRNDVGMDGQWTTPCLTGPVRIDLLVKNGRVARIDPSVAGSAPKVRGVLNDLGDVQVAAATAYLLQLAREGDRVSADRALLSAMLARDGLTSEALRRTAIYNSNAAVPAERWIAALETGLAPDAASRQLARSPELRAVTDLNVPFAERKSALARATREGLKPTQLMTVYAKVPDRAMRVELLDWLSARADESVREFMKDIVRKAVVLEEQQAALTSLSNSPDAAARSWAAEYKSKHEPADERVDARVYNYTYAGVPQSGLAQRVASISDGLVHIGYEVRSEVCGSGIDDDGAGMFALLPSGNWKPAAADEMAAFYSFDRDDFTTLALSPNPSWTDRCVRGPGHLLIDVRRGQIASLQIAVGTPLRAEIDHEFGRVPGPEAANYLIELASRAEKSIAVNAILAAVMAAGQPTLYRDLVRIAADMSRPERVRGTALHWAALDQSPGAGQLIKENAASLPQRSERKPEEEPNRRGAIGESSAYLVPPGEFAAKSAVTVAVDDRQPMETRRKMISWLHEHEPSLIAPLYDVIDNRALKLYVLEYLAKLDNEQVSRKLFEIARGDNDPKMREAAAASLRAHTNSVARAYRQR